MDGPHLGQLPLFNTIGLAERINVLRALGKPLSGYIGGSFKAGYWCRRLEDEWKETFGVKYAVPCNSATSGLLAACMAANIGPGDEVWTTPYTMSATAACALVLGAKIKFLDIEPLRYSLNPNYLSGHRGTPKAIIVTNLFGHPAYLSVLRSWCDVNNSILIEDNAQAPFAMDGKRFTGTIGHMGVFSLNVHKHIQSGEGGVIVTDSVVMSARLRDAINHGELSLRFAPSTGLNLRMTEPIAAIASAQLKKGPKIIEEKRELAHELTDMFLCPLIEAPGDDIGCKHVYYVWAARVPKEKRDSIVHGLNIRGFPMRKGYSPPLNRVFNTGCSCPVAEDIEDNKIITFEICSYRPRARHLKQMREIAKRVTGGCL